jgi:hypothetical protein
MCWQEFDPVLEHGVVVQARCKRCDELLGGRHGHGTSALLTHLKRCKKHSSALKIVRARLELYIKVSLWQAFEGLEV